MKIAATAVLGLGIILQSAAALSAQDTPQPKFGADRVITYKECEGENLNLYVFVPEGTAPTEPRPAIVFFFGGGWVSGTPNQFKTHAAYLKSRGMVAVLADYRTKNSHNASPQDCVADAKSAMRYVRSHAQELGIDPDRIVASGGSAGGHLAAATATLKDFDEPGEDASTSAVPNALVLFNPVSDNGPGQWGHAKVKDYWEQISPAHNIRAGMPSAIVFLGDQDKLIPVSTAKSFQAKMQEIGSRSDLHVYPGKGHGFFNFGRDNNVAFLDTVEKLDAFLVDLRYLQGECTIQEFVDQQKGSTGK